MEENEDSCEERGAELLSEEEPAPKEVSRRAECGDCDVPERQEPRHRMKSDDLKHLVYQEDPVEARAERGDAGERRIAIAKPESDSVDDPSPELGPRLHLFSGHLLELLGKSREEVERAGLRSQLEADVRLLLECSQRAEALIDEERTARHRESCDIRACLHLSSGRLTRLESSERATAARWREVDTMEEVLQSLTRQLALMTQSVDERLQESRNTMLTVVRQLSAAAQDDIERISREGDEKIAQTLDEVKELVTGQLEGGTCSAWLERFLQGSESRQGQEAIKSDLARLEGSLQALSLASSQSDRRHAEVGRNLHAQIGHIDDRLVELSGTVKDQEQKQTLILGAIETQERQMKVDMCQVSRDLEVRLKAACEKLRVADQDGCGVSALGCAPYGA